MYEELFARLGKSKFRSSFHLTEKDKKIVLEKGLDTLREHAFSLLRERISVKRENDGKQTPWKGHPVFVAMHALAFCCRKCMYKWHRIDENEKLDDERIKGLRNIVVKWIVRETNN